MKPEKVLLMSLTQGEKSMSIRLILSQSTKVILIVSVLFLSGCSIGVKQNNTTVFVRTKYSSKEEENKINDGLPRIATNEKLLTITTMPDGTVIREKKDCGGMIPIPDLELKALVCDTE